MTKQIRDDCREIQDKILAHQETKKFIDRHGKDFPLFGKNTPTYNDMKKYIFVDYMGKMIELLYEWRRK